jgi:hypothetical protein
MSTGSRHVLIARVHDLYGGEAERPVLDSKRTMTPFIAASRS